MIQSRCFSGIPLLSLWSSRRCQFDLRACTKEEDRDSFNHIQLCDPTDCSLPGLSVHGILHARILEWVAIRFSRGSSWPHSLLQGIFLTQGPNLDLPHFRQSEPPGKPIVYITMYMYTYIHAITLPYPWNWHNTVNQLYFNLKKEKQQVLTQLLCVE